MIPLMLLLLAYQGDAQARLGIRIQAEMDPVGRLLYAEATFSIPTSLVAADRTVVLSIEGLEVERIDLSGEPIAVDAIQDEVEVPVPECAMSPTDVDLSVAYTIPFDNDLRNTLGYDAFFATDTASRWYPDVQVNDEAASRFHDFTVELGFPEGFTVLTSGVETRRSLEENGFVRACFVAERVEGFALNVGEGYRLDAIREGDLEVLAFHPERLQSVFATASRVTLEAAIWYDQTYGFFPAAFVGIAPGHPRYSGGFPGSNLFYLHLGTTSESYLRSITAHELGHDYWGKYVLSSEARRLDWLMLANGIWVDQLYEADRRGVSLVEQWRGGVWFRRYAEAAMAGHEMQLGLSAEREAELGFDYNTFVRHAKGAVGVYIQAQALGTPRFLEFQRQVLRDYGFRQLGMDEYAERLEHAGPAERGRSSRPGRRVTPGSSSRSRICNQVGRAANGSTLSSWYELGTSPVL